LGRQALTCSVAKELWLQLKPTGDSKRVSYGATKEVMERVKHLYPWMSQAAVNRQLKKLKDMDKENEVTFIAGGATGTVPESISLNDPRVDKGGRPAGTTKKAAQTRDSRKRKAVSEAAVRFHEAASVAKNNGKRVPPGCLDGIIKASPARVQLLLCTTLNLT